MQNGKRMKIELVAVLCVLLVFLLSVMIYYFCIEKDKNTFTYSQGDSLYSVGVVKPVINLNTVDYTELAEIDGVGRETAHNIIWFREKNGEFTSVEQLLMVDGITPELYNRIKDKFSLCEIDENSEPVPYSGNKININSCTMHELMALPSMTEHKAKLIIDYREKYGGFISIDELKEIEGIGDILFEKIKDRITV